MDRAAFLADAKTQAAVVHELLVLGEAVKRLSTDAVDVEEVWMALSADVPRLLETLAPLAPRPPR